MEKFFPKRYDPKEIEDKWYNIWEKKKLFHAKIDKDKKPYVIAIPPPNVTGVLTLGHVLDNTLQDILIRYHKMLGYETLWIPGTDHAGIATQVVVEEEIAKEGLKKEELGRENFIKRVWEWTNKHREIIKKQLKKLGCALDWERERFTLDPGLSDAVKEVFVRLYEKGLVYRGKYIVNWCPRCHTALSDEQVEHKETEGSLYYLRYPLLESEGYITVATTRPETMLGDTAVAVHPEDKRYKDMVGREVIVPLVERRVRIIQEKAVDPDFGTGAVKVTPAHDAQDFEIAKKHNLSFVIVMDTKARMNENAGIYKGLDRFEARKRIIEDLKRKGLFEKEEPYKISLGYCERCKTPIEPYLSEQWFVRMKPLAEPAIKAVKEGTIKFYPERWKNLYFHWMENIKDWCISRQLWWGHRIPVFYCDKCKREFASREENPSCPFCGENSVQQDPDVLDTWFSSWLWPFSTLGWPKKTEDYNYFYPTTTLVTGWDIIFLWVARMIMAGYEFTGKEPFRNVVFHVMIRDALGRKMSKSLGNSPEPLELIHKYGADALRIGLLLITPKEQDIIYSEERILAGRNFCTKIWNSARFLYLSKEDEKPEIPPNIDAFDEWILDRFLKTKKEVERLLKEHDFYNSARELYKFYWHEFCDWYIEFVKIRKREFNKPLHTALFILKNSLKMLHPWIPFVTEEIWNKMGFGKESILLSGWAEEVKKEEKNKKFVEALIEVIKGVRNIRGEMRIGEGRKIDIVLNIKSQYEQFFKDTEIYLKHLGKVSSILYSSERPKNSSSFVGSFGEVYVPLEGIIDIKKEKARLTKEKEELEKELKKTEERLKNPSFLKKAPKEIIEKEKEKKRRFEEKIRKIVEILRSIQ